MVELRSSALARTGLAHRHTAYILLPWSRPPLARAEIDQARLGVRHGLGPRKARSDAGRRAGGDGGRCREGCGTELCGVEPLGGEWRNQLMDSSAEFGKRETTTRGTGWLSRRACNYLGPVPV